MLVNHDRELIDFHLLGIGEQSPRQFPELGAGADVPQLTHPLRMFAGTNGTRNGKGEMTAKTGRSCGACLVIQNATLVGANHGGPVTVERLIERALLLVPLMDVPQIVLEYRRRDAVAVGLDLGNDQESVVAGKPVGSRKGIGPARDLAECRSRFGLIQSIQEITRRRDRIHRMVGLVRKQSPNFEHRAAPVRTIRAR